MHTPVHTPHNLHTHAYTQITEVLKLFLPIPSLFVPIPFRSEVDSVNAPVCLVTQRASTVPPRNDKIYCLGQNELIVEEI